MPSDPARALGLGSTLSHEGVEYRVAPWKEKIKAAYSLHLRRRALDAVAELRADLSQQDYSDQVAWINRDYASGFYAFGNKACFESLNVPENLAYLLWLQLADQNDVSRARCQEIVDADPQKVWDALFEANRDPSKGSGTTSPSPGTPGQQTATG